MTFHHGKDPTVLLVYNNEHFIVPSDYSDVKKWNSPFAVVVPIDLRRYKKLLEKYRPDLRIERVDLSYFHD